MKTPVSLKFQFEIHSFQFLSRFSRIRASLNQICRMQNFPSTYRNIMLHSYAGDLFTWIKAELFYEMVKCKKWNKIEFMEVLYATKIRTNIGWWWDSIHTCLWCRKVENHFVLGWINHINLSTHVLLLMDNHLEMHHNWTDSNMTTKATINLYAETILHGLLLMSTFYNRMRVKKWIIHSK